MSSFYGGVSAIAFQKEYIATFYLPTFQLIDDEILTIKNYSQDLPSNLQNNAGVLNINTENAGTG